MSAINPKPDSLDSVGLPGMAMRLNLATWLTRSTVPVAVVIITAGLAVLFTRLLAPGLTKYCWPLLLAIPAVMAWQWRCCRVRGLFFPPRRRQR